MARGKGGSPRARKRGRRHRHSQRVIQRGWAERGRGEGNRGGAERGDREGDAPGGAEAEKKTHLPQYSSALQHQLVKHRHLRGRGQSEAIRQREARCGRPFERAQGEGRGAQPGGNKEAFLSLDLDTHMNSWGDPHPASGHMVAGNGFRGRHRLRLLPGGHGRALVHRDERHTAGPCVVRDGGGALSCDPEGGGGDTATRGGPRPSQERPPRGPGRADARACVEEEPSRPRH